MRFIALIFALLFSSPAWAAIALDGTAIHGNSATTTVVATGVTISNNDVVVLFVTSNLTVASASGSQNGSYAPLGCANGSSAFTCIFWVASTHSGTENITATSSGSPSFMDAVGIGFTGANTSSPWDVLTGSSFVTNTTFHSSGPVITTNGNNELAIGAGVDGACGSSFTADASWTVFLPSLTCTLAEYQAVATSGNTATVNSTPHFTGSNIGAALKPAGAAAAVPMRTLTGAGQ